jgi:hypothetical protein
MYRLFFGGILVIGLPTLAHAQQTFEVVGARALGMAGAFVAVADDPSAVFWNPAGLVSGQPAGVTIEWVRFRSGDLDGTPAQGAWKRSAKFMSLGTWPIGLSYAAFDETAIVTGAADEPLARRFSTKHYGASILQSITEGLVVGTTLKYVRGRVATGPAIEGTANDALDAGADRDGEVSGTFDLDVSAMFDAKVFRIGYIVRNLRSPEFKGPAGTAMTLERRSRVGVAVLPFAGVTLAMDLDLDTADLSSGPSRMFAVGGETLITKRVALRGGARWNLEGTRTVVGSVGASVAVRPGAWLDGHYTQGRSLGERGFGLAIRAGW